MKHKIKLLTLAVSGIALFGAYHHQMVPETIGAAVEAKPLPIITQPAHPYLAEAQRSSMHGGSYNRDLSHYPGPLGNNTQSLHRSFSPIVGVAPNIAFDSQGRLITVSIKLTGIELHLLDPETLDTIAMVELPEKASFDDNSGGGYFHIDHQDRVILAPANNTISIYEISEPNANNEKTHWTLSQAIDLEDTLPSGSNIHDVIPDWDGNLWFVTQTGLLGYFNQTNQTFFTYQLPTNGEGIQNSFGVAKDGIYVVSTHALYRFEINSNDGSIHWTWREHYQRGEQQKPGTLSHGSGTSPTLIENDLIAIADDGHPHTNVMVYRRHDVIDGERVVCEVPLFQAHHSATENSLMVYGNSIVVQNDYGHIYEGNALETSPGVMRIDVRPDRSGCDVTWSNDTLISQSLPRLSTATGLLYFYTFKKQEIDDFWGGWYLTAVNFETGEEVFDRLIGRGTGTMIDPLSSVTAPVVLGPNGAAYAGIRTGVIMSKDHPAKK